MKKILYNIILITGLFTVSSCDLNLLDNPNAVTVDTTDSNFLLNQIQLSFAGHFNQFRLPGMRVTRMESQVNNLYEQAYLSQFFDGAWSTAYATLLNNIKLMEQIGEANGLTRHTGIARVIKAYVLMTLVDFFGDVPFSEALDPSNFNPKVDPGEMVYQAAFASLQQAKADFQNPFGTPVDLFYANNASRWLKAISALELKYHLNRKLVAASESTSAINALISSGNLPSAAGEDFIFRYGTNVADPAARHPLSSQLGAGGGNYQGVWYMWNLTEDKPFDDPRVRYYMYRQVLVNTQDPDELRCISEIPPSHYLVGGWPFCNPGTRGYWGRDHLNAEGIPPDGLRRTMFGLYPGGGRFDNNSAQTYINPNAGNSGAGIAPIMLTAFVDFMLAEAALTLGTTGDPKELMLSGIRKHMAFVRAFAVGSAEMATVTAFFPTADWNELVDEYIDYVSAEYDAAPANRKMNRIAHEYWLALWGNGIEAYNMYRRTGQPDNMQPGLLATSGEFPRSFLYPTNYIVTNSEAVQKANLRQRVFWDTNPEGNSWVY